MNNYLKFNYLLILSIPFLLITGPFLSDLVIVVLFFSAFTLYFKNQLLINKNLKNLFIFF